MLRSRVRRPGGPCTSTLYSASSYTRQSREPQDGTYLDADRGTRMEAMFHNRTIVTRCGCVFPGLSTSAEACFCIDRPPHVSRAPITQLRSAYT